MKEQDVESFIKRLSGTTLVLSFKHEGMPNSTGKYHTTQYFIVKSASWGRTWNNFTCEWEQTNGLKLNCVAAIEDTTYVEDWTGKTERCKPSVDFNICKTFTLKMLERLKISRTNSLPKEFEARVTNYLRAKIAEAQKNADTWQEALRNHELSSHCEGME